MGRGFSEYSRGRVKHYRTDLNICKEMRWTLEETKKLTCYERKELISWINENRRRLNKKSKRRKW